MFSLAVAGSLLLHIVPREMGTSVLERILLVIHYIACASYSFVLQVPILRYIFASVVKDVRTYVYIDA